MEKRKKTQDVKLEWFLSVFYRYCPLSAIVNRNISRKTLESVYSSKKKTEEMFDSDASVCKGKPQGK